MENLNKPCSGQLLCAISFPVYLSLYLSLFYFFFPFVSGCVESRGLFIFRISWRAGHQQVVPAAPPPKANCVFLTFAVRHRCVSVRYSYCLSYVSLKQTHNKLPVHSRRPGYSGCVWWWFFYIFAGAAVLLPFHFACCKLRQVCANAISGNGGNR